MGRKESEGGSTQKEQMVEDTGVDDVGAMEDVLVGTAEGGGEGAGADDVLEVGCCSLLAGA